MVRSTFDVPQPLCRIVKRHTAAWLVCAVAATLSVPAVQAQEAGGPIVIPGPGEKDSADIAKMTAMATSSANAPSSRPRAVNPAALSGFAPAPAATPGTSDRFDAMANANGAIVIPGAGDAPAANATRVQLMPATPATTQQALSTRRPSPAGLQRVNMNASLAASQVMPVVVNSTSSRADNPAVVRPEDAAPASGIEIDSLASRGEPPELGASTTAPAIPAAAVNRKPLLPAIPVMSPAALAEATQRALAIQQMRPQQGAQVAQANAAPAVQSVSARPINVAPARPVQLAQASQVAPLAASQPVQAAAQPVPAGQEDGELIRAAALDFLKQQVTGLPGHVELTVSPAFPRGLAACTTLQPFLPNNARLWGHTTVGVRCASGHPWTVWLQARVSIHATYYVAARAMAPGEVVAESDLVGRDGDLTMLPMSIITAPSQAVGSITLMRVSAGLPIRQDMLKNTASVTAGAMVRVVAQGDGFSISAEGSALSNAPPGQQVKVKTAAGQIIMGIVKDSGTVQIQM